MLGLQKRIMLYVALGLLILISGFAFFALRAVDRSSDAILRERLVLAKTVARDVDGLIADSVSQLEITASLLFANPLNDLSAHEESMLQTMSIGLGGRPSGLGDPSHVYLTDVTGNTLWEWEKPDGVHVPVEVLLERATEAISGRTTVIESLRLRQAPSTVLVLSTPVVGPGADILGALTVALITRPSNYALFVPRGTGAGDYRLELIDSDGIVVASSNQEDIHQPTRHLSIEGALSRERVQGVWRHPPSIEGSRDHIVALAPLESVPWTVALEQIEDAALALPASLRRQIFFLSAIGILAGLVLAWFTTRQVVRPLTRLTETAGDIASGDLDTPVAIQGQDEARALSRSFEAMRLRLKESLEEIESGNRELEARVASRTTELEQRNREHRQLLEKVITAQEDERKRVSRELHDGVGQSLTGLGMALGSVQAEVGHDPDRLRERLETLRSMTSTTIQDIRRVIADLRPSVLDDLGLVQALGWYVENYLEKSGIEATVDTSGSDRGLPGHLETALFRVLQEAMTNIIKHSGAKNVSISIEFADSYIAGKVRDDGRGFDVADVRRREAGRYAVGLLGMEERMNLLGGSLKIDSTPGSGTAIAFHIPLEGVEVS